MYLFSRACSLMKYTMILDFKICLLFFNELYHDFFFLKHVFFFFNAYAMTICLLKHIVWFTIYLHWICNCCADFPYNLVISLDSSEILPFTSYEYYVLILMLWVLLDCHSFRFNFFFFVCLEIFFVNSFQEYQVI